MNFIESDPIMKLDGGINMYADILNVTSRYKTNESPFGRKVYFLNHNGYDAQLERANEYFKEGCVLTVKEIHVGKNSSDVEFVEFPNLTFNTVMFADVDLNERGENN